MKSAPLVPWKKFTGQLVHSPRLSNAGQVAVEYVLLFSVGIMIALLITSQMVRRESSNPGFLISKWQSIRQHIGVDDPHKR